MNTTRMGMVIGGKGWMESSFITDYFRSPLGSICDHKKLIMKLIILILFLQ